MKIVYVANAYGHISGPLCDKLYSVYKDQFVFIETSELDSDRKSVGSGAKRDFIVNAHDNLQECKILCSEAEIVIFGAAPLEFIEDRIKKNKLTIFYSERLFKNYWIRYCNPITIYHLIQRYVIPSRNSNFYLLCASSYAANDFYKIKAFRNKMYKWGYQPTVYKKDINRLLSSKPDSGTQFIWVGRLVKLKHCDDAIRTIYNLYHMGYDVKMKVIGTGEEEENLKQLSDQLGISDRVEFCGRRMVDETRRMMDEANIFLFTSDFKEGWGATLNECMNAGVACIASHSAGATHFLVKDGKNGFIYESGNVKMLTDKARYLIDHEEERENIAKNAYKTMIELWNPENSYVRIIEFIKEIKKKGYCDLYKEGPCSKAEPLQRKWVRK